MSAPPRSQVRLDVSGLNYHANIWDGGGSTTVLLLHGYLDCGMNWSFLVDALGEHDWHIVAPDWRGHGDTEWIGAGGYYHFTDYVRDLEQLADAFRRETLVVVGHSMGAMAASLWAGATTQTLAGLVLVEGLGPVPVQAHDYPNRMRQWLEQTAPFDARKRTRPMRDILHAESRLRRVYPDWTPDVISRAARFATRTGADGQLYWKYDPLLTTRSPMPTYPVIAAEFWQQVSCPVLWIGGQNSPWVQPEVLDWVRSKEGVDVRFIPGAGHMVQNEASADLASELNLFMI